MSQTYQNLTQEDIDTVTSFFNFVDKDHDGLISKSEIEEAMAVDLDKDNTISYDEKLAAGQEWFQTHFSLQDMNRDGQLSLQELLAFNNQYKNF